MQALSKNFKRAFRHPNFRLLWFGSFFSFVGSWIQNIAQGWLVYELTHDAAKLALVSFLGMAPVSLVGPFAGALADTLNKRKVLIAAQSTYACGALFLASAVYYDFVRYWHILAVALLFGLVGSIEMPARQSLISKVVPPEDLPAAIPLNAMTFNFARVVGPTIGAILLANFGAQMCYLLNGISYLALIFAVLAISVDLRAVAREPQPIGDLLFEGMRYTFRDVRLKTLFVMEAIVSTFGLFYLPLMPAIVKDVLGLGKTHLGYAMTSIGIGAICGLFLTTYLSDRPYKARVVQIAMLTFGLAMLGVSYATSPWVAFPLFAVMGGSAIMQFNTTNTLFQILSPERLRGRVLAMHIWALSGVGPFGVLFFGWFARQTKTPSTIRIDEFTIHIPAGGLPLALRIGALCVVAGAQWGIIRETISKESRLRKPIFIDRDGVMNVDISPYVSRLELLEIFPFTVDALDLLDKAGYDIYVISNQQGVSLGITPQEELDKISQAIQDAIAPRGFQIKKFYYCTALDAAKHPWRKPAPGMILSAREEFGLDLEGSFMIGDKWSDIECGARAGCRPLLVRSGVTTAETWEHWKYQPEKVFANLHETAAWITTHA